MEDLGNRLPVRVLRGDGATSSRAGVSVMGVRDMPVAEGRIAYDPRVGKMFDPWWIIVRCDKDLASLYRWLFLRGTGRRLIAPSWPAHISVNRGVKPANESAWGKEEGRVVRFSYDPIDIATNGKHWWIHCYSDEFAGLRRDLGLPAEAHSGWTRFHMTFGVEP